MELLVKTIKQLREEKFHVTFKAKQAGQHFEKKFKIDAPDKYSANDKIKEKLGKKYDSMDYPTFIHGDVTKKEMPKHIKKIVKNLK